MEKLYAGIDIGGTDIKCGLVSKAGEIVDRAKIPTEASRGADYVCNKMADLLKEMQNSNPNYTIAGVGIGVPGQVIVNQGLLVEAPNLAGWKNIYVGREMEKRLNLPVILDNDANVAALGEYVFGAGRGCREMLMVTLGTGVGGGFILDGKLYRGASGGAGEFGHIIICHDGAKCSCGRRGCVEAYVGTKGLLRNLYEQLDSGNSSSLSTHIRNSLSPKDISQAANSGDKVAIEVLAEAGKWLGVAIGSVANLLNLERVVVGGGVAGAGDFILEPARQQIANTALKVSYADIEVIPAKLGNEAGLTGAACLIMTNEE